MKKLILAVAAAALFVGGAQAQTVLDTQIFVDLDDDAFVYAYQNNVIQNATVSGGIANTAVGSTINADDVDLDLSGNGLTAYTLDIDVYMKDDFYVSARQNNTIGQSADISGGINNTAIGSNIDIVYDDVSGTGSAGTDITVLMGEFGAAESPYVLAVQVNDIDDGDVSGGIDNAAVGSNINLEGIQSEAGLHNIHVSMDEEAYVSASQYNYLNSGFLQEVTGGITNTAIGSSISLDFD